MWEHLRGDFPLPLETVPSFNDLEATVQEAARQYMKVRLLADHYLDDCERLHVRIFNGSIETDLVEDYAVARDRYEHSVEEFGETREAVQKLLSKLAA